MTLPLAGVKVLELSENGFVPATAAVLADWGADVVKIERLSGDPMRSIISSGLVATHDGYDFLFQLVNRNKRAIALDVTTTSGRQVFERLVRWADVYVTNQLPRVRRKLHTDPSDLHALNPRLVFAKGHGYGQRGADADTGGYDAVSFWARGGVGHVVSDPEAAQPAQQRPAMGDVPTGMFFAGAICAALVHSRSTGTGIVVDTSLLNGATWTLGPDLAYASMTGGQLPGPPPPSGRSPLTQTYRTADGRFVTLMMIDEGRYWSQACRALGQTDLIDRYPDPAARAAARGALHDLFRTAIAATTRQQLQQRLQDEGCIFSFYASPPEVVEDPTVGANGYLMAHPDHPSVRLAAAPGQFDDELPAVRRPGPRLGEHTREVLTEIGYTEDAIDELVSDAVVAVS